ncbi:MAG: matrixin family metalloprotease [Myxococcota bacterium]|nr:matrixin family metalloprotease [Myxococcota bacterium]
MKQLVTLLIVGALVCWGASVSASDGNPVVPCGSSATYHPLGYLWFPLPPKADNPLELHFHQAAPSSAGGIPVTQSEAQGAVMAAFGTWELLNCAPHAPNLPHVVAASALRQAMDTGDVWDNQQLMSHNNVVFWDGEGTNPLLGAGTIAYTNVMFLEANGHAVDGDMMFNDVDFKWRVSAGGQAKGCSSGTANCFDVQTVALHEAGHFVGLGHVDCGGAVMYPEGSGAASHHILTSHEGIGVCALYPPRSGTGERMTGEFCESPVQCPENNTCLVSAIGATPYGSCVKLCAGDQECDEGFFCEEVPLVDSGVLKFCKPGLEGVGTGTGTGTETGTGTGSESGGELCTRCSSGSHCRSGLCMMDEESSFCSQSCSVANQCPEHFSCIASPSGASYCWPDDPTACGIDTRASLNDVCYQEGAGEQGEDYHNPCGPGLKCMGFRPRCEGVTGACVLYCDIGTPCADNLTCCYGIDANGHCMGPTAETTSGGCFDLRVEGEACVTAEQSVCAKGFECVTVGSPTQAKCYETCDGGSCVGDERCGNFSIECDNSEINLCCDNSEDDTCLPGHISAKGDTGVACYGNADCYSGKCLTYNGKSACTRSCDLRTGVGCPDAAADVNGDGVPDGGFDCVLIADAPRCWPKAGPVPGIAVKPSPPTTGCCRAVGHPLALGDLLMSALVWLPFAFMWRRSRRRRG